MKVVRLNPHKLAMMSKPARQVIALGFFDGVHQGHQHVIARARQLAHERHLPLAVMTFNRHVSRVFNTSRQTDFRYLNTISQKLALLAQNQVDTTYVVDFDRNFAGIAPEKFVRDYLMALNADVVVGGFDYTFGRGGQATIADMPRYNHDAFDVVVVSELAQDQQKIGSTQIRRLIKFGHIEQANELLGHQYALAGQLVQSRQGEPLQFRPASRLQQLPPQGTYDCQLTVGTMELTGKLSVNRRGLSVTIADLKASRMVLSTGSQTVELGLLKRRVARSQQVTSAQVIAI